MAELYFLGNSTKVQMLGMVICTKTKTFVIDGGTPDDYPTLSKLLKEKANGHVDGWFFTHAHYDHIGAFLKICENNPEIEIDRIFCHFPPFALMKQYEGRLPFEIKLWEEFETLANTRFSESFLKVKKGDAFSFDELDIKVLRVYNEEIIPNFINNSSTIYRIDSPKTKVLILGDLGVEGGEDVMKCCTQESLYADYTQMAHHGQSGANQAFYQYIKPQKCLWATPDWLWDNDNGGGKGSGRWKTLETRAWMETLGVKEHIVQKDGTTKIIL